MSESPVTTAAVNKAAKAASVSAAAVSSALPTVVETAELAMQVPSKVVLNQRLVVLTATVAGAALGAGILFGVEKFRNRNKTVFTFDKVQVDEDRDLEEKEDGGKPTAKTL